MNDNTGEMPNPLNPNNNPLDANPAESQPLEEIVEEVQAVSVAPAEQPADTPAEQPANTAPVEQPVDVAPVEQPIVESVEQPVVDLMARPMEKAPVPEPVQPKKKKTGLIVAGIIAAVVAIGCGVAAAIIFALNSGDPVAKAIEKIASGNLPAYANITGAITITPNEENPVLSNLQVNLDSSASTTSLVNTTKASVTANFANGDAVDFTVEEKYGSNGDLYLRFSDIAEAIESYTNAMNNSSVTTTDNCIEDENGNTICDEETLETVETVDCETADGCQSLNATNGSNLGGSDVMGSMLGSFGEIFDMVDGEWLRVSVDELSALTNGSGVDNETTCIANVIANPNNYKNGIVEAYNNNQFISSTTEGVKIASKSGQPVRKVVINNEKLNGFKNAVKNTTLYKDLMDCSGSNNVESTSSSTLSNIPTMYVEVDKDYNFTRVTFDAPVSTTTSVTDCDCDDPNDCDCENETSAGANANVDFSISYPDRIDVAEPTEYTDLSSLLQQLFLNMYSAPGSQS